MYYAFTRHLMFRLDLLDIHVGILLVLYTKKMLFWLISLKINVIFFRAPASN